MVAGRRILAGEDFVVLPLTRENIDAISALLTWEAETEWDEAAERVVKNGRMVPTGFFHVQIAAGERVVFCAYDNFDPNGTFGTDAIPLELLDRLVADGVIRSYAITEDVLAR